MADNLALNPEGGVYKKVLKEGKGLSPPSGAIVQVHYTGRVVSIEKGEEDESTTTEIPELPFIFDTTRSRAPFKITVGQDQTIQGLDIALAKMNEGEIALITIHPRFGYGPMGNPHGFHGFGKGIPPGAVLEFELELSDVEREEDSGGKIKIAQKLRELGNDLFAKEKNPGRALIKYKRALTLLDGSEASETKAIKLACHLNSAACQLQLNACREAMESAQKAIEIDSNNAKAHFRMAKGQIGLGYLEEAQESLKKALAIEDLPEIRKEMHNLAQKIKESKNKQKKLYSNMLGKLESNELYTEEELKKQAEEDKKSKIRKCNYCDTMIDDIQWARHMIKYHGDK